MQSSINSQNLSESITERQNLPPIKIHHPVNHQIQKLISILPNGYLLSIIVPLLLLVILVLPLFRGNEPAKSNEPLILISKKSTNVNWISLTKK